MLQLWRNSAALNDLRRESCELDTALGGPVAFAPDGKHAVLCKFARDKRYLTYWNIAGSKEIRQIGDDSLWPAEVGFCGEDKVVCRSREGRLVCWNTKGEQLWETKSTTLKDLRFLVFSNDGKLGLAAAYGALFVHGELGPAIIDSAESTYSVRIWNLEKGTATILPAPTLPEGLQKTREQK
jgi:WD40 repeat protein